MERAATPANGSQNEAQNDPVPPKDLEGFFEGTTSTADQVLPAQFAGLASHMF